MHSAYLTAAWNDGLSVTVTGLRDGAPLHVRTVVVETTAPTLVQFNYLGIDELVFEAVGGIPNPNLGFEGTHFVMDNLVIAVPEPSALTLGWLGGLLLAAVATRRWRSRAPSGD